MTSITPNSTKNRDDSARSDPFRHAELMYRKAGWLGVLMLPTNAKNPPPTGFTGKAAPYPSTADIAGWPTERMRRSARGANYDRPNIALRLAGVDRDHEVIGIDVDHYEKGGKHKVGFDQLARIENQLGCALPATWVSSARTDGRSGIRYFRVPRGLHFAGQVDKDIECIQKGHRFAVVWPSINPDTATAYWWFPPGVSPDESGRSAWDHSVPDATKLPVLPEPWIDFLTNGRTKESDDAIDMVSAVDDVYQWATATFGEDEPLCDQMRASMEKHLRVIREEATSHDKIVAGHRHLIYLAEEGHKGWDTAVSEVDKCAETVCAERDKRDRGELRGEIFRSRSNALRKAKPRVEAARSIGAQYPPRLCTCDPRLRSDPDATIVPRGVVEFGSGVAHALRSTSHVGR